MTQLSFTTQLNVIFWRIQLQHRDAAKFVFLAKIQNYFPKPCLKMVWKIASQIYNEVENMVDYSFSSKLL